MTNRRNQTPGRGIRRAGPIVGVLATVGIALGAWAGIASAAGNDAPKTSPASVTGVEGDKANPSVNPNGDKNKPTVDGAKDKPKGVVEAEPKVLNPGKPFEDKTAKPMVPGGEKQSAQLDPANPKINNQGPQSRAADGSSVPKNDKNDKNDGNDGNVKTPAPVAQK